MSTTEKYILTAGRWRYDLDLYRVKSETPNQLKAVQWWSNDWANRISTINRSKVLATFDTLDAACAAMSRAKKAWERAAGPVGDAERILGQRREKQRADWLAALTSEDH